MSFRFRILLLLSIFASHRGWADADSRQAVRNVQDQMRKPGFAREAAKDSPEAAKVTRQVQDFAGSSGNEDAIYSLAADVLGNMQDMTPDQMMQFLTEAQKDPGSFAKKLTPEQQKKLHEIAERVPAAQKSRNP